MAPEEHTYLPDVSFGLQAPAPCQRAEDLHLGVLALGEALVLAALPCRAHQRVALVEQHAIDAFRVQAAGVLVRGLAVAAWDLGQVCSEDLHLPHGPVHLQCTRGT